jgi:hypothetical protein
MQVHPASPQIAVKHTVESLTAGYIGLDFADEVGDLFETEQSVLPDNQRDYWGFAHEMQEGDRVLVIAHHFPVALVRVSGPYNYIRQPATEIGVWFRHFRKIDEARYYADFRTDVRNWAQIRMTDTISPLRNADTLSYRLIEEWLAI